MTVNLPYGMKRFAVGAAIALAALLAGCGGGGGGDAPALPPSPPSSEPGPAPEPPLALMFDSMGRQLPEADFGHGDALAAGADGIAFDDAPMANAQVMLVDNGGSTRTATTDASGYYRLDIKNLRLPFIVKVKRKDGGEWFSAGVNSAVTRGFIRISVNGLTDKALGYVADAANAGGGAASAVTPSLLGLNTALLGQAKEKLRAGLAVPLVNAGLDPASYDPVTAPLAQAAADRNAAFLRGLRFSRNPAGRTAVIGAIAGSPQRLDISNLAVDGAGNMYVTDGKTNVIRKISPAGVTSTLAGGAAAGFADGTGAAASFHGPTGVALGPDGNLYVADASNNAIRKVTPAGVVTTLAGGAGTGFTDGVGAAAKFDSPGAVAVDRNGNVYVTDINYGVRKITAAGAVTTIAGYTPQNPYARGGGTPAVTIPAAMAVDGAGNVYYVDAQQRKVVKLTPAGASSDFYTYTYQGPFAHVFTPGALAVDAAGTVYLVDRYALVARIDAAGVASTLAGSLSYGSVDGNGASARFTRLSAITVEANGNLLVADSVNGAIRRITPGGDVTTVLGKTAAGLVDGPAASAAFSGQWVRTSDGKGLTFLGMGGVAVDPAGTIYLADTGNHAIRRIARSGAVTTLAGNGVPGFANGNGGAASFNAPNGLALDSEGNIYVADSGNNAIRKITASGDVSTLAGSGAAGLANGAGAAATFNKPLHVAVGPDATVYVSDVGNFAVRRITAAGLVSTLAVANPVADVAELTQVGPITVDSSGTVLVKGWGNGTIYAISADGVATRRVTAVSPWRSPSDSLAADGSGNIYYLLWHSFDGSSLRIVRRSAAGVETDLAVDGARQLFDTAWGHLAVDGNGNVVVVDAAGSSIRIVLP